VINNNDTELFKNEKYSSSKLKSLNCKTYFLKDLNKFLEKRIGKINVIKQQINKDKIIKSIVNVLKNKRIKIVIRKIVHKKTPPPDDKEL